MRDPTIRTSVAASNLFSLSVDYTLRSSAWFLPIIYCQLSTLSLRGCRRFGLLSPRAPTRLCNCSLLPWCCCQRARTCCTRPDTVVCASYLPPVALLVTVSVRASVVCVSLCATLDVYLRVRALSSAAGEAFTYVWHHYMRQNSEEIICSDFV